MNATKLVCDAAKYLAEHPDEWKQCSYGYWGPGDFDTKSYCVFGKAAKLAKCTPVTVEKQLHEELNYECAAADITTLNDEAESAQDMRNKVTEYLKCDAGR